MDEKNNFLVKVSGDNKDLNDKLQQTEKVADKSLSNVANSAKNASSSFVELKKKTLEIAKALGIPLGVIGIFKKGLSALGQIYNHIIENWNAKLFRLSETLKRNAESIRETAEANDELRKTTDGYMQRLQELSNSEKLSNVQKLEQARLLEKLRSGYSDLVDKLTDANGKLKNVDQAFAAKLKRDQERQVAEIKAEMEQIKADRDIQRGIIEENGFWRNLVTRGKSTDDADKAAESYDQLSKRYMELMKKLNDLKKTDKAKEYLDTAKAMKKDREEAEAEKKKAKAEEDKKKAQKAALDEAAKGMKALDDASKKYADAEKKRAKAVADEQIRQDERSLDSRLSSLRKKADAQRKQLASFGFDLNVNPDETASERRRRVARNRLDESIAEKQEMQRSGSKIRYTSAEKERIAEYRNAKGRLAKTEEQIAQLEAAGKAAEAARQEQQAAERLQESASALSQAAMDLRSAGGVVPSQPMQQAAPPVSGKKQRQIMPVPGRRVNVSASNFSQVTNYTPMLANIIGLLKDRALILR